jgi:hypothetical protein
MSWSEVAPMTDDDSGSGWSDGGAGPYPADVGAGAAAPDPAHPFQTEERDRYQRHDLIGAGGMGRVYAAWDRRLGREVALKTLSGRADDASLAARLARESWITARLEHPGIVPIYDAGHAADGGLFYSMRLIRGRSLAEAMAGADATTRLGLLRSCLAFCHAVAYAHDHGVVHRDLKPANLMVGEFGDSTVVDWGLAVCLDDTLAAGSSPGQPPEHAPPEPRLDLTRVGVGTPAYMSPEQAAGQPVGRAADVWALGAILYEVVVGRPLLGATSAAEAATMLSSDLALAPLQAPEVPPELAAIITKALRRDPDARYPDAGALSVDLAAFLDGRRVAAHAYGSLELLRRLVRAWRVPIGIGVVGVAVALTVFALTWRRVQSERQRAVGAERQTSAAMRDQQVTFAHALVGWATNAHDAGASPEAEVIAARALTLADSAEARGVLAAAYGRARPLAASRAEIPGCDDVLASSDEAALCGDAGRLRYLDRPSGRVRWTVDGAVREAAILADGSVAALRSTLGLWLLSGQDGALLVDVTAAVPDKGLQVGPARDRVAAYTAAGELALVDVATRRWWRVPRMCGGGATAALALGRGSLLVACADGAVMQSDLVTGTSRQVARLPLGPASKGIAALAVDDHERRVALAGVEGTLTLVELATGTMIGPVPASDGSIARIGFLGDHLLVTPDQGAPALWDPAGAGHVMTLPGRARVEPGRTSAIEGVGPALWSWRLPSELPPWRFVASAGLSHAAVSADHRLLAVAGGDGAVTVWSRRDGRQLAHLVMGPGVVKRVAFSPDGGYLAAGSAGADGEVRVVETTGWTPAPFTGGRPTRRVFFRADGALVAFPYGDDVDVWLGPGPSRRVAAPRCLDATVAGDVLWLLTEDEQVVTWRDGVTTAVVARPGATTLAVSADGALLATVHAGHVALLELGTGAARILPQRSGQPLDVTISPDRRWVLAGTRSGTIDVWSTADGRHAAALRGHRQRSAAGVMAEGGRLLTSSWDGTVRTWDLGVLDRPAAALEEEAARTWQLSLDDVVELGPPPAAPMQGAP